MPRPAGHLLNRDAWDDLLERSGLTLTQVADLTGIPRSTVSSLLGGFHKASVPNAHLIASAIGCRVGTLFPTLVSDRRDAQTAVPA